MKKGKHQLDFEEWGVIWLVAWLGICGMMAIMFIFS